MAFTVTPFHEAIFDAFDNTRRNLMINAVAGSGKTTTILEVMKRIPDGLSTGFFAFNKSIVAELQARVPAGVDVKTLHGLGQGSIIKANAFGRDRRSVKVDGRKMIEVERRLYGEDASLPFDPGQALKLLGLAKNFGIVPEDAEDIAPHGLVEDTVDNWLDLMDAFDLTLARDDDDSEDDARREAIRYARRMLKASLKSDELVDFDDMLYVPVTKGYKVRGYDVVFVDEAQDLSKIQFALISKAIAQGGRIVAVGDPFQAIYGFRGADSNSMANLKAAFDMVELPLSVTYRCPAKVVEHARRNVPHLTARPGAPDGRVVRLGQVGLLSSTPYATLSDDAKAVTKQGEGGGSAVDWQPGDMVVSRTTKPLVALAFSLIRQRVPCRVLGRDIGESLLALVKKVKGRTIPDLRERLAKYLAKETKRLKDAKQEDRIQGVEDKVETLGVFLDDAKSVADLKAQIETFFAEGARAGVTTLCTVHKSKGLEAPRVFILNSFKMPMPQTKPDAKQQEINLIYVAETRTRGDLVYIDNEAPKKAGGK